MGAAGLGGPRRGLAVPNTVNLVVDFLSARFHPISGGSSSSLQRSLCDHSAFRKSRRGRGCLLRQAGRECGGSHLLGAGRQLSRPRLIGSVL